MKRTIAFSLCLFGLASAQFSAPGVGISVQAAAPVVSRVARHVLVQPERLEMILAPGYTTGTLTFTLLSDVQTEVFIRSSDARLVNKNGADKPIVLSPYNQQSVSLVALAAHSGTLIITNTEDKVIEQRSYVVAPAKAVYQGASLNYSPSSNRVGMSYSVSGVTKSPLDPSWSASVNLGLNTHTEDLSGGVSVNVSW